MMFENLEDRRLMSAASLVSGTLTVNGTARNDVIYIAKKGANLSVRVNNATQTFSLSAVKKMVVNGLAGNDNISFGYGTIGATINGGDGNDHIIGTSSADTITGGAGNDYIHAWLGNDVVDGGAGNDTLIGCIGNDTIHGGAGNDLISGAEGDDQIFGDAGNDTIFGAKGNDKVDGGDGSDVAYRDGKDTFTRVERIR